MRKKCQIFKLLKPPKHQLRGYHWMLFYLSTITIIGTLYLALYNTRIHPFFVIQSQVFLYLADWENLFPLSSSFFLLSLLFNFAASATSDSPFPLLLPDCCHCGLQVVTYTLGTFLRSHGLKKAVSSPNRPWNFYVVVVKK